MFEWFLGYSRNSNGIEEEDDVAVKPEPKPDPKPNPKPSTSKNSPPVAKAGEDMVLNLPYNRALLNGSRSDDKNDWIASFKWRQITGPRATILHPTKPSTVITGLVQGYYKFRLVVKDHFGASSFDDIFLRVNACPIAKSNSSQTITLPQNEVPLNGLQSVDYGGWIKSYKWTKVSGPNSFHIANPNTAKTKVSNLKEGLYAFRLTVVDGDNAKDYYDVIIRVKKKREYNASSAQIDPAIAVTSDTLANAALSASLSVQPNPAISTITVTADAEQTGKTAITIHDISGRPVKSSVFDKNSRILTRTIDISSLNKGIYLVTVMINSNKISTQKFIKE